MKITKENIEYFIFDYHEGNLSDSDKAEVLNFIHLHPEYENDFTHWAQSYFHAEGSIKNYGIADALVQKDAVHWYINKWFVSGGAVAFLAIVYSYLFLTNSEIQTKVNKSASTITEKQIEQTKKSTPSIGTYQNQDLNNNTGHSEKQVTIHAPEFKTATITLSNMDTLVLVKNDIAPVNNTIQQNAETVDTLQKNNSTQQNNTLQTKKSSSKHKSKLNLKPDNKFIPTNPDF